MLHRRNKCSLRGQRGFSLVETLVVVVILTLVMAIVTAGLIELQKRTSADTGKVDVTQMGRQFMDQIINDLHQSGYPGAKLYDPAAPPPASSVAVGLIGVSSSAVDFEADVDGSGTVSHVWLQVLWSDGTPVASGAGACPCTLQRGTLDKSLVGTTAVPYYTEVNNLTNSDIFSAYFFDGSQVTLPASAADLPNIKSIKVTVNLQSPVAEADGTHPTITMASEAKIHNN